MTRRQPSVADLRSVLVSARDVANEHVRECRDKALRSDDKSAKRIYAFLDSLDHLQNRQLDVCVTYAANLAFFKLLVLLEAGFGDYTFVLRVRNRRTKAVFDLISPAEDLELRGQWTEWERDSIEG